MTSGFPAEQLFDAAAERLAGQAGVAQATGGPGTVAQHHVVPAAVLGEGLPDVTNRPVIAVRNHSRWAITAW